MKIYTSKAFSLIELIFVILLISIISSIAIPKLLNTSKQTSLLNCKNDLALIQNALINFRLKNQLKNENNLLTSLDNNIYLFENILQNPIIPSNEAWTKKDNNTYIYNFNQNDKLNFNYNSSNFTFLCDKSKTLCKDILK